MQKYAKNMQSAKSICSTFNIQKMQQYAKHMHNMQNVQFMQTIRVDATRPICKICTRDFADDAKKIYALWTLLMIVTQASDRQSS